MYTFRNPKTLRKMIMPTYYFQCVCQNGWEASRRMCCDLELLIKRICFETKNLYTHVNERLVPHETAKWNAMNWMTSIRFESIWRWYSRHWRFHSVVFYALILCCIKKKHTWSAYYGHMSLRSFVFLTLLELLPTIPLTPRLGSRSWLGALRRRCVGPWWADGRAEVVMFGTGHLGKMWQATTSS